MNNWVIFALLIGMLLCGGFMGFILGLSAGMQQIMDDAIRRDKAQYNPKTKKFEWKP